MNPREFGAIFVDFTSDSRLSAQARCAAQSGPGAQDLAEERCAGSGSAGTEDPQERRMRNVAQDLDRPFLYKVKAESLRTVPQGGEGGEGQEEQEDIF